jgi:hypothetical protein
MSKLKLGVGMGLWRGLNAKCRMQGAECKIGVWGEGE